MNMKKNSATARKGFRILMILFCIALVMYAGLICFVWIQERAVSRDIPEEGNYDAIVVLGAQVLPDGTPSVQLSWRLDKAVEAWQMHPVPTVVCGAQGADEPMTEAEAMRDYLVARGLPEGEILLDSQSFNTNQNLQNAAVLLRDRKNVKRVLIVTSDYHVPRAMALARDLGYEAAGLGSPCKQEYWIKNHAREALAWIKYWGIKYLNLPLA